MPLGMLQIRLVARLGYIGFLLSRQMATRHIAILAESPVDILEIHEDTLGPYTTGTT